MVPPTNNLSGIIPRYISDTTRKAVFARDGNRCRYCGSRDDLQVDHVFPHSKGGDRNLENLALACRQCNGRKSNRIEMFPYPVGYFDAQEAAHHRARMLRIAARVSLLLVLLTLVAVDWFLSPLPHGALFFAGLVPALYVLWAFIRHAEGTDQ